MENPKQVTFRDSLEVRDISPRSSIRSDGTPKGAVPRYPTQRADYVRHTPTPRQPGDKVDESNMYYVDSGMRSLALHLGHLPSAVEVAEYLGPSSGANQNVPVAPKRQSEPNAFRPNSPLNPDNWNEEMEDRKRNFRSCISKVSAVPTESQRSGRPNLVLHLNMGTIIRNTKDSDTYVFHTAPSFRGKDKELDDDKLNKLNLIYIRHDQRVSINGTFYAFRYDDDGLRVVPAAGRSAMKPSLDTRNPLALQEPSAVTRPNIDRTPPMEPADPEPEDDPEEIEKQEPEPQYNESGRRTYTAYEIGGELPPGVSQVKLLGDDWPAREEGDLLLYLAPNVAYLRDPQTGAYHIRSLEEGAEAPSGYAVTHKKLKWRVHSGGKFKTASDLYALQGAGRQMKMIWVGRLSDRG